MLIHLVVAYGFHGDDEDTEKLGLTDQLFDAALCELAVVSRGHPCVSKGSWWALGWARAGFEPDVTCKRDWACLWRTWRDFILGCPLAAAALEGCWVDFCRWIQPRLSVCASFVAARWSAEVSQPVMVSPLWLAS